MVEIQIGLQSICLPNCLLSVFHIINMFINRSVPSYLDDFALIFESI